MKTIRTGSLKIAVFLLGLLVTPAGSSQISAISRAGNVALVFPLDSSGSGATWAEVWSIQPWKRRQAIAVSFHDWESPKGVLSRDGKLVAFGRRDSTIELYQTHSGRLWKRLGRAQAWRATEENDYRDIAVSAIAFSPNRRLLASGNSKGVFVWRVRDGKLLFSRPLAFFILIGLNGKS